MLDEPINGLDPDGIRWMRSLLRSLAAEGRTVLLSSHIFAEVEKLCDVIGIIHGGRLVAEGTLAELQARYGEKDMEEIFVKAVGGEAALIAAMKN